MPIIQVLLLFILFSCTTDDRVAQAQKKYASSLHRDLNNCAVRPDNVQLLLLAFKEEGLLEAHVRSGPSDTFRLFKTYRICARSGGPGPKRRSGDMQVPEGFYRIDRFNAQSRFHLSLGISYPNTSDRLRTDAEDPGSDIFIHGGCATIGCLPLGNEAISELYVLALMARERKPAPIPVYIFPCRMEGKVYAALRREAKENAALLQFWEEIRKGYDIFKRYRRPLQIAIDKEGVYRVS